MHVHVNAELDDSHEADPYDQLLRAGRCRRCGYPTRERTDAELAQPRPVVSPFVRRALLGQLPAAETWVR